MKSVTGLLRLSKAHMKVAWDLYHETEGGEERVDHIDHRGA